MAQNSRIYNCFVKNVKSNPAKIAKFVYCHSVYLFCKAGALALNEELKLFRPIIT